MKLSKKIFLVLFVFLLAACRREFTPAEQAVQNYLQALVDKDESGMMSMICSSYEMDALLELDSYGLFDTRLRGVSCREVNSTETEAKVICEGNIEADYVGGTAPFGLSERTYSVVNEQGSWLVCGYTR